MAKLCHCLNCTFYFKDVCTNIDCDKCGQSADRHNQGMNDCCDYFIEKPHGMIGCFYLDDKEEDNWFD